MFGQSNVLRGFLPKRERFAPNLASPFHRGTTPWEIWRSRSVNQTASSTSTATFNNLFASPIIIGKSIVLRGIGFNVTTVAGAGGVGRCGLYRSTSRKNIYPSTLIVDGGEFDTNVTGAKVTLGLAIRLVPGLYWGVVFCGVASPVCRSVAAAACPPVLGIQSALGNNALCRISKSIAYGALPATFPGAPSLSTASPPEVFLGAA